MLKPEPTALEATLRGEEEIAKHRRLYCAHYDGCLNASIASGWQSFSCTRCALSPYAENSPRLATFAHDRRNDPNG